MVPIGDASSWMGDYRYMLGSAFLVAPILDATGKRDVLLPAGAKYYDWFAPMADAASGGTTVAMYDATDRAKYPLFVREGAIVPMHVDSDVVPVGTAASKGMLTVLVYPSTTASTFTLYEDDDTTTSIAQSVSAAGATIALARAVKPTLLRVRTDTTASSVTANGAMVSSVADFATLAASTTPAWFAEPSTRSVWVKIPAGASMQSVVVK
jgi:alpha-D-xyloside xylohydrolase